MSDLLAVFSEFGVRETIVLLVVFVAVYMLVVVLRMKGLSAPRKADGLSSARYDADLAQSSRRKDDLDRFYVTPPRGEPVIPAAEPARRHDAARPVSKYFAEELADPPRAGVASFDQEKLTRLERELSATREELDALRSSFAEVRDELRAEVERLKAAQRVSPLYADSMQMAIAGASAEEIAARCGIARAEAELVLSLARGRAGESGASDHDGPPGGGQTRYGSY